MGKPPGTHFAGYSSHDSPVTGCERLPGHLVRVMPDPWMWGTRSDPDRAVLTNSENGTRDAEKAVKNRCGTLYDLARQSRRLETEVATETQVPRNNRGERESEP